MLTQASQAEAAAAVSASAKKKKEEDTTTTSTKKAKAEIETWPSDGEDALTTEGTSKYKSLRKAFNELMMTNVERSAGRCTEDGTYSVHGGKKFNAVIKWDALAERKCKKPKNFPHYGGHMLSIEAGNAGTLCAVVKLCTGGSDPFVESWASIWRLGTEFKTEDDKERPTFVEDKGTQVLNLKDPVPAGTAVTKEPEPDSTDSKKIKIEPKGNTVKEKLDWAMKNKPKAMKEPKPPCNPHEKTLANADAGIRKALQRVAFSAGTACMQQWKRQ